MQTSRALGSDLQPRMCSVVGCDSWSRGAPRFKLPEDPERRLQWVQFLAAINKQRFKESSWTDITICSEHFKYDCFDHLTSINSELTDNVQLTLNPRAVPSLCLQSESEEPESNLESPRRVRKTRAKSKACPHCQCMNAATRKTCQSCFAGLFIKERIKLKEESLRSGDWGGKVKEHRNASRVVDSAHISVKKLHELGFKPLLFMMKERRGVYTTEVITCMGPVPEGPVRDIIKKMTALYEYLFRNYELLATATAPSDEATPAPPASSVTPKEEPFDPDLVPAPRPPPSALSLSPSPSTTHPLPSLPLPPLSLPSPPPPNHSLTAPPLSSPAPPTLLLSYPPPSTPLLSSPLVKGLIRTEKELLGKRKRNEHTGCTKHTRQKIFFFEKLMERRPNQKKTRAKTKACLYCQGMNPASRKTCQICFASLSIKEKIKLKEESLCSGEWGGKVKEHRNESRVVDSAHITIKKLHELGFKPLLFMGKERRSGYAVEVITGMGPIPEGPVREILKKMTDIYEYLSINHDELLATATVSSDEETPAASVATVTPKEEPFEPAVNFSDQLSL